ncbi:MAG: hypothetical protein R6V35_05415 [Candidatus Nanohaloarchaea archaeon]
MTISNDFRGQSAIEYLMTYGWMLLVVAVVGGAVFSTVQGQCNESVSGFTGADVMVGDFGSTSTEKIQFELRNTGSENVEINKVTFRQDNTSLNIGPNRKIEVSDTELFSTDGFVESSSCNTVETTITYDTETLSNLEVTGTLTTSGEVVDITNDVSSIPQDDFQMRFDAQKIGKIDGEEVNKWNDLTNGENNATGINDSRLPEVNADGINGYQALKFEPEPKDILTMEHKNYLKSRNHTIFAVAQFNEVSGTAAVTSKYETGSRVNTLHIENNKTWLNWNDNEGWKNSAGRTNVSNRPRILSTRVGKNITGYVDGSKDLSQRIDDPLTLNDGPVSFGAVECGSSCSDYWELDGNIGEIIYYNKTLSDSEMDDVHNYLSQKWSVHISE